MADSIRIESGERDRRSIIGTIATSVAILALTAIGGLVLARVLGPSGRGELASLVLWGSLAMDVALVGSTGSLTFHVAVYPETRERTVSLVARTMPLMSIASLIVFGGLVVVSGRMQELDPTILVLFALYPPLRIVVEELQALLQGDRRFRWFNAVRVSVVALPVAGIVALAWSGQLSVGTAGIAYVVALASTASLAWRAATPVRIGSRPSSAFRRDFWSYSLRNWLSLLSAKGNRSIDLFFLTMVALPAIVGQYAVATTVAGVIVVVGGATGMVAMPRIAGMGVSPERSRIFWKFLSFAAAGTLAVSVPVLALAGWLIPLLYGGEFIGSVGPARILIVGYFAVSLSALTGGVLRGLDRPGTVAVAQFVGFLVTLTIIAVFRTTSASQVAVAAGVGFWVTLGVEVTLIARVLGRFVPSSDHD